MLMERDGQNSISVIKCRLNPIPVVYVYVQIDHTQTGLHHMSDPDGRIIKIAESSGPPGQSMMQTSSDIKGNLSVFIPYLSDAFQGCAGNK